MIDFEREIEARLSDFLQLTRRGNVKDGHITLHEIIRLMMGMISQTKVTARQLDVTELPVETTRTAAEPLPSVSGAHTAIDSASLLDQTPAEADAPVEVEQTILNEEAAPETVYEAPEGVDEVTTEDTEAPAEANARSGRKRK